MSLWDITVLNYGQISIPKGAVTPGLDMDLVFDSPYLGFLLQNGKRNIVVDTGISEDFFVDGKAWGNFPAMGGRKFVEKALSDCGVDPLEVNTVIYTHLHNDHAANATLFENARLIFQKEEWLALLDPLPIMNVRRDYDPTLVNELKTMNCIKVDGDFELTEGIKCIRTPGHTIGSQSIVVQTKKGIRVIVGDHWHLYCMAFAWQDEIIDIHGNKHKITPAPEVYGHFIPASLINNFYDYYDSSYKILSMIPEDCPEYILPGHEASLLVNGV
jgi:glyoxylase-like metal-dependent hydrolase (beta-lactamase superfamily II)